VNEVKVYVQVTLDPEGAGDPIETTEVHVYSKFGKALSAFQRTIEAHERGDESSHIEIDRDFEHASAWLRDGGRVFIDPLDIDSST
jgi:hypothetical protein